MKISLYKIIIVVVLAVAIAGIIVLKFMNTGDKKENTAREKITAESGESFLQEQPGSDPDILVTVNNIKITRKYFEEKFASLPDEYKSAFQNDKDGFLNHLVTREILYQEAVKKGFVKNSSAIENDEQKKDNSVRELLINVSKNIKVSEAEMRSFYRKRRSDMQGASFEQVKLELENYLRQQKQDDFINKYIAGLEKKANIVKNAVWVKEQEALKAKHPFYQALKNGKPTVLDLGAGTCVPCKMMKPIFEELGKEYQGRANIILLEISENRDLATKYRVRVIPTQIFFDKNGNENWRHEGFLAKEEIVKKLKELGAK